MKKRAVVISYNWKTRETLSTDWEGDGAADKAAGWAHKESFLWKDFPAKAGWTHIMHWTPEAGRERSARMVEDLCERGSVSLMVPR